MNIRSLPSGMLYVPRFLDSGEVGLLVDAARDICLEAPLRNPTMPDGTPLHLKVTNAGPWGWWSDRKGYRYVDTHPTTGKTWPHIPKILLEIAARALDTCGLPQNRFDNLLINHYESDGSLGLHVDKTEDDQEAPIVSLSVGADAVFLMGGPDRKDKTEQFIISTGDLVVQSGPSRRYFHGIKKLLPTLTSPIKSGRLNFTFRKVRVP